MSNSFAQLDLIKLTVEFYEMIARMKRLLSEGMLDNEVKQQLQLQESPQPEEIAYATQITMLLWLEKTNRFYAERLSSGENKILQRALFAMAALADELMLLEIDWPGQPHWQDILLEENMFRSCRAGTALFDQIDQLLTSHSHAQLERQLAGVYLLVLRLGFSGRYRQLPEKIEGYRQDLYSLIDKNGHAKGKSLCAEAYDYSLFSHVQQRLAPISKWISKMIWAFAIFVILSSVVWSALSWEPSKLNAQNVEHNSSQIINEYLA